MGFGAKAWPYVAAFASGTVIGNVKTLFEIRDIIDRRRTKIVVQSTLSGHRDYDGSYVYITNLSAGVVLINHWEIFHRKPWWDFKGASQSVVDSENSPTRRIEPNEEIVLSFNDDHWFNPWPKNLHLHSLCFRFMVTGEKRARVVRLGS